MNETLRPFLFAALMAGAMLAAALGGCMSMHNNAPSKAAQRRDDGTAVKGGYSTPSHETCSDVATKR